MPFYNTGPIGQMMLGIYESKVIIAQTFIVSRQ